MIVYEDENLLVLNKPTGVTSVPHGPEEKNSAVNFAVQHFPKLVEIFPDKPLELGLVHRLDTGTSGLLVFAKTSHEFLRLKTIWKNREIKKIYRAWVKKGSFPQLPFEISSSLANSPKSSKRVMIYHPSKKIRGKPFPALTRVLKSHTQTQNLVDLEIQIETGVRHQIRCHLASLKAPILGDPIYSGDPSDRLWLHAWKLEFQLNSGALISLEADLPEGWHRDR